MMLEKNWTIRTRIVLSFVGILATIVICASFAYVRLRHIDTLTDRVSDDILPALTSSSDIVVERVVSYSRTLEYAFEPDQSRREEILKGIAVGRASIDALLTRYKPTIGSREEQDLLDAYQRARAIYRLAQDSVLEAGLEANINRADLVRRLTLEVRPKFEQAQAAAFAVRVHNEVEASESMRLIDAEVHQSKRDLVLSVAVGLLVAFVLGYRLLRAVTMPLGRLVGMLDVMRTGDLSGRLDRGREDEFGDVAKGFNRMTDELMGLVGQVQQSGVQVNTSITEIAATAREQQATASQIAATTTQIGATSREISATSRLLVGTMNEVATVAEQSAVLAGQGQSGLTHLEETMQRITEAAAVINGKLRVLSEKAGNISQVVTTITKVADQTNLLSLNAAIEAEKAGEYGRGFAVVATEVRRLADQTAVATYDIEQMVKEIQSAVAAGVMGMDKFSEEVRRGMQDVHQVGDQLSQVIQQVQALAPRVESINDGMQAQASGAAQITEALAQLSDAAQQTVDSLRQSGLAIDELNRVAAGLRSGVSRFTLQAA